MIETYYDLFLHNLLEHHTHIEKSNWDEFAGQRFLYVSSLLKPAQVTSNIHDEASQITKGTKLSVECIHVRTKGNLHVYRFRFLVPNEKMFCCGNFCVDCIRLKN